MTKTVNGSGYQIHIGSGLLAQTGKYLAAYHGCKSCIVSDSNVAPLYGNRLFASLQKEGLQPFLVTVPAGEISKSADQLLAVYGELAAHGCGRHDLVLALGGGVIGDLAGFAAATYMRGLDFIQLPTSLLAQVDSSVGGKVAIDLPQGKNLAGTFYNPKLVLADLAALETLDQRQFAAGMAEVIKYACIKDAAFFERLAGGTILREELVCRCVQLKQEYVAVDPLDQGCRAELNFGHTLGHGLEQALGYGVLLHGEGVAIGMAAAARLSQQLGLAPDGTADRITSLLQQYHLPIQVPPVDVAKVAAAVSLDKKGCGTLVLLKEIGNATVQRVSAAEVAALMEVSHG